MIFQDQKITLDENFDVYASTPTKRIEITKTEWLEQEARNLALKNAVLLDEQNLDYVSDSDEDADEVVKLPPKVVTPGGAKAVKRVPRKR